MFLVFSPFFSRDFGSSLLSSLWIIFQVGCLFRFHLFGLVGFYLGPSSVTYFSCRFIFFFLFWWVELYSCLTGFWPEASSTGIYRQLYRAGSSCCDDLWEASFQLIFPGVWGSLLVQWFGLSSHHRSLGPTSGLGTKILQAAWHRKKKKKKRNKDQCNIK